MPRNKTVLIVEDEEEILSFVDMLLTDEGYQVKLARNGDEGLQSIRDERPGVILLDLTMPGIEPGEFTARVRSEFGPGIPVVILSAGRDLEEKVREIGADDFLAKPFDVGDLVAKVEEWTSRASGPTISR